MSDIWDCHLSMVRDSTQILFKQEKRRADSHGYM